MRFLSRLLPLAFLFFLLSNRLNAEYSPISAVIVVDAASDAVVYSHNADQRIPPASLAKMMTLLLTFKALEQKKFLPTTLIHISPNAASQKPCVLGVKSGDFITVRNAILALITKSANDIAVALAEHIGKTVESFAKMMNKEAKRLGMSSTLFVNPSGWKNPKQLTTARDMAKLARALLMEYPGYYHLFSTKQFCFDKKLVKSHNKLLGKRGDVVVDGIKTGFLTSSGFNIVVSAVRGKHRLIAVVLGGKTAQQRDAQANLFLRKGFFKLSSRVLLKKYNHKQEKSSLCKKQLKVSEKIEERTKIIDLIPTTVSETVAENNDKIENSVRNEGNSNG